MSVLSSFLLIASGTISCQDERKLIEDGDQNDGSLIGCLKRNFFPPESSDFEFDSIAIYNSRYFFFDSVKALKVRFVFVKPSKDDIDFKCLVVQDLETTKCYFDCDIGGVYEWEGTKSTFGYSYNNGDSIKYIINRDVGLSARAIEDFLNDRYKMKLAPSNDLKSLFDLYFSRRGGKAISFEDLPSKFFKSLEDSFDLGFPSSYINQMRTYYGGEYGRIVIARNSIDYLTDFLYETSSSVYSVRVYAYSIVTKREREDQGPFYYYIVIDAI